MVEEDACIPYIPDKNTNSYRIFYTEMKKGIMSNLYWGFRTEYLMGKNG